MPLSLTHVIGRAHLLLAEVLDAGAVALDLTAGNGCDTLFLAQQVGDCGCVLAFDVQQMAVDNSLKRLSAHGISCRQLFSPQPLLAGVNLVREDHAGLKDWCPAAPVAVIANLGFLPGGDRTLVTTPRSTLEALSAAVDILALGGRLAVVVYPGHAGGSDESEAVMDFFCKLDAKYFAVLYLTPLNRQNTPYLLVADKIKSKTH
jgi:16S rRNA C1402 N4-methylase RsmH